MILPKVDGSGGGMMMVILVVMMMHTMIPSDLLVEWLKKAAFMFRLFDMITPF